MEAEINMPRGWIEGLLKQAERVQIYQNEKKEMEIVRLLGYIDSAKYLLNHPER